MRWTALALLLAGCATSAGIGHSDIYPVDQRDVPVLSRAITDFVLAKEGPSERPIVLQPAAKDQVADTLRKDLSTRGYHVTVGGGPVDRVLKYEIGPFGKSTLLRVSLNGGDAAKLYTRGSDGSLVAVSPFTARGPGEGS